MRVLEINVDDIGMGGVFSLVRSLIFCCDNSISIDIAAIEPFEQEENKNSTDITIISAHINATILLIYLSSTCSLGSLSFWY